MLEFGSMAWRFVVVGMCLLSFVLVGGSCSRPSGDSSHAVRARLTPDELLTKHRTILLRGDIDDKAAEQVIAKLLFLQHKDASAPVHLYIDSQGGAVTPSLAIRDTIDDIKLPIFTHCLG